MVMCIRAERVELDYIIRIIVMVAAAVVAQVTLWVVVLGEYNGTCNRRPVHWHHRRRCISLAVPIGRAEVLQEYPFQFCLVPVLAPASDHRRFDPLLYGDS